MQDLQTQEKNERQPLILKEKTIDMLLYMKDRLKNFPKEERSGIIPRIKNTGYEMLELASDIGNGFYTMTTLKAYDRQKNHMESYLYFSLKAKYITPHQHKTWGEMVVELGRINGGLTKALEAKQQAQQRRR